MKIMRWIHSTSTLLAVLAVSTLAQGQTPQKPLSKQSLSKQSPVKKSVRTRPVSGGSNQLVIGGDDCASAVVISGQGTFAFDTSAATTGTEGEGSGCYSMHNDVWYDWTADVTGVALFSTCDDADFDTMIAVYSDCPAANDDSLGLGCNDDGGGCAGYTTLSYADVIAGVSYKIRLGGYSAANFGTGNLTVSISGGPLTEDDCANPAVIAGTGTWAYSTFNATTGTEGQNETLCDQSDSIIIAKDIWFEWTAPADGLAVVQNCAVADHDTKIAAYSGAGCPADGTAIACNDDSCGLSSKIEFSVTSGSTYTLQIGCYNEIGGGAELQIDISGTGGTANDDCANAEVITGDGVFPYDNLLATTDGTPPSCLPQIEADVWFAWTSPGTYLVEVQTCGLSSLDTALAVYDGAPCSGGAELTCVDDACGLQTTLNFNAIVGSTYWIRAGNYPGSAPGLGSIEITTDIVDPCGQTTGPDVIVGAIPGSQFFGVDGSRAGYSWASTACNVGDMVMGWWANTNVHPVIAQNMYRIEDGRFEQLGMSWLKHGWASATESVCCTCQDPGNSQVTGVGCADTYGAGSNGGQGTMGPRWEVNPFTGEFPFPYSTAGQAGSAAYKRLSVEVADLDPALHPNAQFIAEVQYIQPEDSEYGNQGDNVSHREVSLGSFGGGSWDLNLQGETAVREPALLAWVSQTGAHLVTVDVPDEGRFHVGSNATETGSGTWRYDYVLYNQNFTRGMESLEVPVGTGAVVWGDTFHAPPHHSGDPQSNAPWTFSSNLDGTEWRTDSFTTNPDANVVVWGKAHTLSFLSDQAPVLSTGAVGLFDSSVAGLPVEADVEVWAPEALCGIIRHCTPAPNSTGAASSLHWYGSARISANSALLYADNLPASTPGLFYYGTSAIEVPFGDGLRCAGGDVIRMNPALFTSPQGDVARPLDFNASPLSSQAVGDTIVMQFWYRDNAAGASGFNLSDALIVILCP